jgi:hypothetical protein
VVKKSKNGRKAVLSAKARRRQEKGFDRAEAFIDKKEKKVEKSKGRARTVQERSKAWEDLNKKMLAQRAKEEAERIEKENWVDVPESEVMEDVEVEGGGADIDLPTEVVARSVPLPGAADDEEEVL